MIILLAARANRRTLLLGLVLLFLVGNGLSALAPNIGLLVVFRFVTGSVQGAFFGAGAVVAAYVYGPGRGGRAFATVMGGLTIATIAGSPLGTFVGQQTGWRVMYWAVVGVGLLAGAALVAWLPRTEELHGNPVANELRALRRGDVWLMVTVAALGISSIFAVYTFIGPFVTDAALRDASLIPLALAVFGLGMAVGNHLGGRIADRHADRGLIGGYGGVLILLVLIGLAGSDLVVLLPCLFGVGATMMYAIPAIQVRLTSFAPDAPTLMGRSTWPRSTWPTRSARSAARRPSPPAGEPCPPPGPVSPSPPSVCSCTSRRWPGGHPVRPARGPTGPTGTQRIHSEPA
ncbi:MFS transporter [Micromonospora sp. M12]